LHRGTQVTCDSHTDFKVKRSKVKVTGSISAAQRNVPIFRYDLQIWHTHCDIGRGQFLPRTTNWPEIGLRSAGAGAYRGGHLAAQLVIVVVRYIYSQSCNFKCSLSNAKRSFTFGKVINLASKDVILQGAQLSQRDRATLSVI